MTEKSRSEFILEAIKALIWPILIIAGVIWLGNDFKDMLQSRTFKIGGVLEVGDKVSDKVTVLQDSLQQELLDQKASLQKILASSADPAKVSDLAREALNRIDKAQVAVKKDIQQIQQTIPQAGPAEQGKPSEPQARSEMGTKSPKIAKEWESLGFQRLVTWDIESSIQAFSEAEKIWPDYHNVAEIRQLLVKNREELRDRESPKWKEVCQKILADYSWGMPPDARRDMEKIVAR
ncbi:hypothetical protein SAMN04489760_12518 [Syntrophus gentianae]|uniref:Uncharacterized protein n=1 Tax=Syntrophus gentianae TaxID=43775 RepID=A0A1H7ZMT4_9BACT|nr:hypothetical protein [Syntrophus gentianae]SEM59593.1 hypothetical protein SAMN04489760_12518 [Syntrophus gentianae]